MNILKKLIIGTPLEGSARFLLSFLRGYRGTPDSSLDWVLRDRRDKSNIDKILRRTLANTSNCIDIGAHKGVFLKYFIELSPEGHHFAFEPLPGLASALKQNFPMIDVFPCALGNRTGRVEFYHVFDLPGWSGFKIQPYPLESKVEKIEVDINRLDDVIPPDIRIDFIKIDVEGAELEVFEGAKDVIKKYRPSILFEHAKIHNSEYKITTEMVYDFLTVECELDIFCLDGRGPLTKKEIVEIYHSSFASNYNRYAQTNFIARPV